MEYSKHDFLTKWLLTAGLMLSPFPTNGFGQGPRPINRPTTIIEPGAYVLQRSFNSPTTGTAIVIRADGVSLDLSGEILTGPGSRLGTAISIEGANGVRVHNGKTASFGIGVRVMNSTNVSLENLQINGLDLGGAPPDVEIGVLIINSRGVLVKDNVITKVFLGVFVRGGGSGGNRIVENTMTGAQNGMLGICYNPSPTEGANDGPSGDLVYNNLIARFATGIAMSARSIQNILRENDIAYFTQAINEAVPNTNTLAENTSVQIAR